MLKTKQRTKGRKYPRRAYWIEQSNRAYERAGNVCEVSKEPLLFTRVGKNGEHDEKIYKRACDHVIPERWVRRFMKKANPHVLENLIVLALGIHAKKTAIERKIYSGDWIGYCQALRAIGFDQVIIDRALKALNESAKRKDVASRHTV
jgi:hypothetical protein